MDQADAETGDIDDLACRNASDDRIHVAPHDMDGAITEGHKHIWVDDISGMQNDFNTFKVAVGQGLQKRDPRLEILEMRVGQYTDPQLLEPLRPYL